MRLWITGYRSYELGIFNDNDPKVAVIKYCLENNLNSLLEKGLEWVITGGQLGTEQWALEVAEKIAMTNFELKTSLMYPFSEFGSNWKEDKKIKLRELEENCDFSAKVSSRPYESPQQLRNYQRFMLEHTEGCLLLYDKENEGKSRYDYEAILRHQENNDYFLQTIDMFDLQDASEQYQEIQSYGLHSDDSLL